jgi:hypothetical protein
MHGSRAPGASRRGAVGRRMTGRGLLSGDYVSPYLQRRLRNYEEVRQQQVSRQVLDAVILQALSDAKAAGHGPVGQIDLATQAALTARPDWGALDALEAVEKVRRRDLY